MLSTENAKAEELRLTHWHKSHLEAWENITEAIPAVAETELRLWAHRVERKTPTLHCPHVSLFVITASHYALRADGVNAPDGQELSFMVAADCRRDACNRVVAKLDAHGLNGQEWALGSTTTPLVLDATKGDQA